MKRASTARVKLCCCATSRKASSNNRSSRDRAELLAKNPKSFGRCFINGPRAHPAVKFTICRDHRRNVAVFAVNPTFIIQLRAHSTPNCSCCTLLNILEPLGTLEDTIFSIDTEWFEILFCHVATTIGEGSASMRRKRTNTMLLTPLIQLNST